MATEHTVRKYFQCNKKRKKEKKKKKKLLSQSLYVLHGCSLKETECISAMNYPKKDIVA